MRPNSSAPAPPWSSTRGALRAAALLAWILCACAGPERAIPSGPERLTDEPGVGEPFVLDLEEGERAVRLQGVRGRVTLVCVLGDELDGLVEACAEEAGRWGDRLAVLGLDVREGQRSHQGIPFRVYLDPGGAALGQALGLGASSQVIAVDARGRVHRTVPLGGIDELRSVTESLIP